MPRGATDMSHVWEGRRKAALARRLAEAKELLEANGRTVIEPVDERKALATTQPAGR